MTVSVACAETRSLHLPMRPCAGIALFNARGRVWVGSRCPKWASSYQDYADGPIWQLPQGGIDKGESARDAAFRELWEETGVTNAMLIAEIPGWLSFELPQELMGVALKGKFGGQRLRWFVMRFCGADRSSMRGGGPISTSCRSLPSPSSARFTRKSDPNSRRSRGAGPWTGPASLSADGLRPRAPACASRARRAFPPSAWTDRPSPRPARPPPLSAPRRSLSHPGSPPRRRFAPGS
jgi:8-oxo-dGTP pyrophosphatase MutT (NUDIX family)